MKSILLKILVLTCSLVVLPVTTSVADIGQIVLEKARKELIQQLKSRGYPNASKHISQIDAAKLGTYLGQISAGETDLVVAKILQEQVDAKVQAIREDLFNKGKTYAVKRGVLGPDTQRYLSFVENNWDDLRNLSGEVLDGDLKGAGNLLMQRMRERVQVKVQEVATGYAVDTIDFFLKDLAGQSVGTVYFKIIELEMMAIEKFKIYTIEYFSTFTCVEKDGSKSTRNWCIQYEKMRQLGHNSQNAFYLQDDSAGCALSIADMVVLPGKWYSTSQDDKNGTTYRPDNRTMIEQLESCYTNNRLKENRIQDLIEKGRTYADDTLFGTMREGMEAGRKQLVTILDGVKFENDFLTSITVVDKRSGNNIKNATVMFDGERKDAPDGTVTIRKSYVFFDQQGDAELSAQADAYKDKFLTFSRRLLANRVNQQNNTLALQISLFPDTQPDDSSAQEVTVLVSLLDAKNNTAVKGGTVRFAGEQQTAINGIATFTRKMSFFTGMSPDDELVVAGEASGYKSNTTTYTGKSLTDQIDKDSNRLSIELSLDPDEVEEIAEDFSLDCYPTEIFQDENSICNATLHFPSGKSTIVNTVSKWQPVEIETTKGIVRGDEILKSYGVPYTVKLNASYNASKKQGGKNWAARARVKVKDGISNPQPRVQLSKSANSTTISSGDTITYTYTVTNPGNTPLRQIKIKDDKCSPVTYTSGDANKDKQFDLSETWVFKCDDILTQDTVNQATVTGETPQGTTVTASATATVKVKTAVTAKCPPPQVEVPYLLYLTEPEAIKALRDRGLGGKVTGRERNVNFLTGQVIRHTPVAGVCVAPGTVVDLILSSGSDQSNNGSDNQQPPDPAAGQQRGPLTAEIDCGDSFELAPGSFIGRSCNITVRNWNSNTEDRVEIIIEYNTASGVTVTPGDWSVPPSLMFNPGVSDTYDRYVFTQNFRAKDNASPGTTTVSITVRQQNGGSVSFSLTVAVLEKGLLPSSGPGIRPPANPATGAGGKYCVWRYKMFGDPPPCFHLVKAVCDHAVYTKPSNGYELVGQNMSWSEGGALMDRLGRYFQNEYGCDPFGTNTPAPPPPAPGGGGDPDDNDDPDDPPVDDDPPVPPPDDVDDTPTGPVLTRFGVFCSPSEIKVGELSKCSAVGEYSDDIGNYITLTGAVQWTNGPSFKGQVAGSFEVTAFYQGVNDTASITVKEGDYDPGDDPGLGTNPPEDTGEAEEEIAIFQGERPGGGDPGKQSGNVGGGETATNQPTEYNEPSIGGKPPQPPEESPEEPAEEPAEPTEEEPSTNGPGIEVTEVGPASPGMCQIVDGQLVAVDGYPEEISGMTVVLNGPVTRTAVSSGGGQFKFPEIPAGDYTVSVKGWDYGMTSAQLKAPSGKAVKIVLKGSCPYLYVWTREGYIKENDIYSTARLKAPELAQALGIVKAGWDGLGLYALPLETLPAVTWQQNAYHDFYKLQSQPAKTDLGTIQLKIAERQAEYSFTDMVQLHAIPRKEGYFTGVSRNGEAFYYHTLQPIDLRELRTSAGSDSSTSLAMYNQTWLELRLPAEAFQNGVLAVSWQGFQDGSATGHSAAVGRPQLQLQRKNSAGEWITVDWIYPRDKTELAMLPLQPQKEGWDQDTTLRLQAISCLPFKFHRIDRISWAVRHGAPPVAMDLPLVLATGPDGNDSKDLLSLADNKALTLGPEESTVLNFDASQLKDPGEYDYIFESRGVYLPAPQVRVTVMSP